jgi:hypothetical protein
MCSAVCVHVALLCASWISWVKSYQSPAESVLLTLVSTSEPHWQTVYRTSSTIRAAATTPLACKYKVVQSRFNTQREWALHVRLSEVLSHCMLLAHRAACFRLSAGHYARPMSRTAWSKAVCTGQYIHYRELYTCVNRRRQHANLYDTSVTTVQSLNTYLPPYSILHKLVYAMQCQFAGRRQLFTAHYGFVVTSLEVCMRTVCYTAYYYYCCYCLSVYSGIQ